MSYTKLLAASLAALLCVGCATNSDVRLAKEEALNAAAEANRKADEALAAAREANARSLRHEEMLNRGFKRSMYK